MVGGGLEWGEQNSPCRIIVGKKEEKKPNPFFVPGLMVVIVKVAVVLYGVYGMPGIVLALYLGHLISSSPQSSEVEE